MKKLLKLFIILTSLVIFGIISIYVYTGKDMVLDSVVYSFINRYFMNDNITIFIKIITWFGGVIGIPIVCIILMFIFRDRKINTLMVINLIMVIIINNILKILFMRARPDINPLIVETSYSFPSGHSMIAMAFYGYLIYIINIYKLNVKVKYFFTILLSVLILVIGISRIYLGVHYVSDVIGGFCFGIVYLITYISIVNKITR